MTDRDVIAELRNIVQQFVAWPGDTLSHKTANECIHRGWVERTANGNLRATPAGMIVAGQPQAEGSQEDGKR